jgi:hypothetical protein
VEAGEDPGLPRRAARSSVFFADALHVRANSSRSARQRLLDELVLGREHEERRAEERVRARREHGHVDRRAPRA